MNRLEKTLGAIFFAGTIVAGIAMYRGNKNIQNVGNIIGGGSVATLLFYESYKYKRKIERGNKMADEVINHMMNKNNNDKYI